MTRIILICDSLSNSIIAGQIVEPLKLFHQHNPTTACVIISFEQQMLDPAVIATLTHQLPFAQIIVKKRLPFMGTWSLLSAQLQLKHVLKSYSDYELIARGPLAGWLALHTITTRCTHLIIQARSLLAQEYLFTHRTTQWWGTWWFHWFRARQLHALERQVYATHHTLPECPITIESVSPSLTAYLVEEYHTPAHCITLATYDKTVEYPPEQCSHWRSHIRTLLAITPESIVYCYNGSIKPWQCPELIINFFVHQYRLNPTSILLILTPDIYQFKQALDTARLPATAYRLITCSHTEIYQYLAAADYGLLFRQQHIINWTSRPTKLLEYQAVRLPIIHNNTIALCSSNCSTTLYTTINNHHYYISQ